ncbi:MAG TPA: FHA domain-containing protein, partial [Promineifilum sp.]|nr:FHA domain-containing protein [Promineifilum sp.]
MTEKFIIITHPSRPTAYFKPDGWLITIGSAPGNDLVLSGPDVSARHARLEEKDGRWLALDMDSSSGTYVGNNALLPGNPEELLADQRLRIGEYPLELRDGSMPDEAEPPPAAAPEPAPTRPRPVPAVSMRLIPAVAV